LERKPIYALMDCNSSDLDRVPINSLMLNKSNGGLFDLVNRTGLINNTSFKDITGKNLNIVPYGYIDDKCVIDPNNPILGKVCIFIYPGDYWSPRFIEYTGELTNKNPNLSNTYIYIDTNKYASPDLFYNIEVWNKNNWGMVAAVDNDASMWIILNDDILPNYGVTKDEVLSNILIP